MNKAEREAFLADAEYAVVERLRSRSAVYRWQIAVAVAGLLAINYFDAIWPLFAACILAIGIEHEVMRHYREKIEDETGMSGQVQEATWSSWHQHPRLAIAIKARLRHSL